MSGKNLRKLPKVKFKISEYRFLVLMILGIASLILGLIGFTKNGISLGEERTLLDNLYLMFGLLSMNSGAVPGLVNLELQIARFSVPIIAASTAILAFSVVFREQMQQVKLWFIRDHIIICGLGRKGYLLAKQFRDCGEKIIIIEIDEGNNRLKSIRSSDIIIMNGDANDPEILHRVRINRAKYIISVIGDEGKNAEVAVQAEKISQYRKSGVLKCIIHIEDPQLWYLLREKELHISPKSYFRLEFFNIFNRGAKMLINLHNPWKNDLGKKEIKNRLIIIGLGQLGQSLVVQAALEWRRMNKNFHETLKILIIDLDADEKKDNLCVRYPQLVDICEFETFEMDVRSTEFQRSEFLNTGGDIIDIDSIFICLDNDSLGLHAGLRIYRKTRDHNIPVIIRMVEDAGLAHLLDENALNESAFKNLIAFPILDQTCTPALILGGTHELLARELHEAYLEGIKEQMVGMPSDLALRSWDELKEETKEKNRTQADRIAMILENHGFRIAPLSDWKKADKIFTGDNVNDKVESMAKMEHELWREEMLNDGWKFGIIKSNKRKINPSLLPWETLREDQSKNNGEVNKTTKFILDLPKVLQRAGFQIEEINVRIGVNELL